MTILIEHWRPVVGYEDLYEVSDQGRVRRDGRVLKPGLTSVGYPSVALCRDSKPRTYLVHQLVLEAFVGLRPEGYACCHQDGTRDNNHLSNLRWDTPTSNQQDRIKHGTTVRGTAHHCNKLHPFAVWVIKRMLKEGYYSQEKIGRIFGIHQVTVSEINRGLCWGWVIV